MPPAEVANRQKGARERESSWSRLKGISSLIHLQVLAGDGVEEDALAAVGLDLLDSRRGEGVRLDSEPLGRQLDGFPVLVVAPDHLDELLATHDAGALLDLELGHVSPM